MRQSCHSCVQCACAVQVCLSRSTQTRALQRQVRSSSSSCDTGVNVSGIRRDYSVLGVYLLWIWKASCSVYFLVSSEVERRRPTGCQVWGPAGDQLKVLYDARLAERFGNNGGGKKPQQSGCFVKLQKCYGKMCTRKKKIAVWSREAMRSVLTSLEEASSRGVSWRMNHSVFFACFSIS